jgi:hypothetical protein
MEDIMQPKKEFDEDLGRVMIETLWAATSGTVAERDKQMTDAIQRTAAANPTIKGEKLFFLILQWMRTRKVIA